MSVSVAPPAEGLPFRSRPRAPRGIVEAAAPLGIFVGLRLALLIFGFYGFVLIPHASLPSPPPISVGVPFLDGWVRPDAMDYLVVARDGYWSDPISGLHAPEVPPLLPILADALGLVGLPVGVAAIVVSNASFGGALVLLHAYVRARFSRATAVRSVVVISLLPYSFLFASAAPWSLVLLLAVAGLLAEDRRRAWVAGVMAALAALAHPFGLVVWPAIAARRLVDGWSLARRKGLAAALARPAPILSLAIAPLAVAGVALYLHADEGYRRSAVLGVFAGGLARGMPGPVVPGTSGELLLALNLGLGLATALTLPRVARAFGPAGVAYCVGMLALGAANPLNLGTAAALAFPGAVVLADLLGSGLATSLFSSVSPLALAVLTGLFVAWFPVNALSSATASLTPVEWDLATYHVRFARERAGDPRPRDLVLTFDQSVLVLGENPLAARYAPGARVPLAYDLAVLRPTDRGYLISARLRDARGAEVARSDKVLWGHADAPLFARDRATSLGQPGFLQENLDFPLPPNLPFGAYALQVLVFRIPTFERLPLATPDGGVVDELAVDHFLVGTSADAEPAAAATVPRVLRADLGDHLALRGYGIRQAGSTATVALYWEATAPPSRDYTVFVQALDGAGQVVAQSDSYPAAGRLPTTDFPPGQVVRDVHVLAIPPGVAGPLRVIAGMYRLDTMSRLPVRAAGAAGPDDHVALGELDPRGG